MKTLKPKTPKSESLQLVKSSLSIPKWSLHSWLDWVITDNLPLCTPEKKTFREYSHLAPISENTLSKYLRLVEQKIDEKLKEELPDSFGVLLDGWSEGTTHYYGIFAAYSIGKQNCARFLTISPPFEETAFGAKSQADFIVDVVENLGKRKENILFLVGDNTNTNPATANLLDVPFIGCASHRFNLAVEKYLERHGAILQDIHELMKKLSTIKKAGKLRQKTKLEPVIRNATRWSSAHEMVKNSMPFVTL